MESINPATNELLQNFEELDPSLLPQTIQSTQNTWEEWKQTGFSHRAKLMCKAADILIEDKLKYAELISNEMGKAIKESIGEIEKCALVCRYYADNAEKILEDEIIPTEAHKSFVAFEPLGIVLAVMPWNFPFWQVFRFAAPALMAGNAGLLKHASNVSGCAIAIEEVFNRAGFPKNLFQTLLISTSSVPLVIQNGHVKAITLTGSEFAGSKVAEIAGRELKKTVLELGGSDAFIVLDDAELSGCVHTAVHARLFNNGQSCIAAKRFIVHEKIADQFEERLKIQVENLIVGNPLDEKTSLGPMAREDLLAELDQQVQQSIQKGAKLLSGGKRLENSGCFYAPTILSGMTEEMPAFREETFGPVFAIIRVKNDEEAIRLANQSEYGLGGSVWSMDLNRAEKVARQIETGAVFVNAMTKSDPRLPFGGVKKSGYGRELSHYGIKEFVNIKTIWVQ